MTSNAKALAKAQKHAAAAAAAAAAASTPKKESPEEDPETPDCVQGSEDESEQVGADEDSEDEDDEDSEDEDEIVGKRYVAVANGAVRAEFDLESEKVGKIRKGEVIEVLSARKNDAGIMRVEIKGGWTSTVSRDGKRLLKRTDDDAELSNIVVAKSTAAQEAAIAEAEAFAAAQTMNKEYQVKLKGAGKVTVQLSAMGLQVTTKKDKPPTTYLYQTLKTWGSTDKGFEVTTSDSKTMSFECDERDATAVIEGMTSNAKALAKAQKHAAAAAAAASTPKKESPEEDPETPEVDKAVRMSRSKLALMRIARTKTKTR